MDFEIAAQQAEIEHQALRHVMQALETALAWEVEGPALGRKVSSVRFMAQSLERHLRRMIVLEEDGGYMQVVTESKPHLSPKLKPLQADHARFCAQLDQLMAGLREVDSGNEARFGELCESIRHLLADVTRHNASEASLVQQVLVEDEGGEG